MNYIAQPGVPRDTGSRLAPELSTCTVGPMPMPVRLGERNLSVQDASYNLITLFRVQ